MTEPKFTRVEVRALYDKPLLALLDQGARGPQGEPRGRRSAALHAPQREDGRLPRRLLVLPQSSKYETSVGAEKMLDVQNVIASARRAKEIGSTRFCMGAAWREGGRTVPRFDRRARDGPRA